MDDFDFTAYDQENPKQKYSHAWIAGGILALLIILGAIQCQVSSLSTKQRKLDCALVTHTDGTTRKATDYEYYECIGK